jgi:hypothetical protein
VMTPLGPGILSARYVYWGTAINRANAGRPRIAWT